MTRAWVILAGGLGFAAPLWTLGWYAPEDTFARGLIAVMLLGFAAGLFELFRRASELDALVVAQGRIEGDAIGLEGRLHGAPTALLRLVRSRQQGEPRNLPAPGLAPFLVSLLVLLGLLGTFVGLISTLAGARDALSVSGDVSALRAALLVPMQGLSRAFGTSVAGVSASAMLGLALTLTRRVEERLYAALDDHFAAALADATLVGRQMRALERLAGQSSDLPEVVARLAQVVEQLPRLELAMQSRHDDAMGSLEKAVAEGALRVAATLQQGISGAIAAQERALATLGDETGRVLAERAEAFAVQLEGAAAGRAQADELAREEGKSREAAFSARLEERWQRFIEAQQGEERARAQREEERVARLDARLAELFVRDAERQQERSAREQSMAQAWVQGLAAHQDREAERAEQSRDTLSRAAELAAAATRSLESSATQLEAMEAAARVARDEAVHALHAEVDRWLEAMTQRLASERADVSGLADHFAARGAALEEQASARLERLGELVTRTSEQQAHMLQQFAERSQHDLVARDEAARAQLAVLAERVAAASAEQQRVIESLAAESARALRAREDEAGDRLRDVTERVVHMTEARLEAERRIEDALRTAREEAAAAFSSALGACAEEVRAALGEATLALRAGTEGMAAGGIEMALLAEKFSLAVDHYREASEAWLSHLPALAGQPEGTPPPRDDERLGDMLERTRDMFDRSMELQMELYRGVRALRDGAEEGGDTEPGAAAGAGGEATEAVGEA